MRILAGILLIASVPLHALSGAGAILQAKAEAFLAREDQMIKNDDLSAVAGDLVDEQTLKREQARAERRAAAAPVDSSGSTRLWLVGLALLVLAAAQLLAGVQLLRGRTRTLVLAIVGLSVAARGSVMVVDGLSIIGAVQIGLLALALVLAWRALPSSAAIIPTT